MPTILWSHGNAQNLKSLKPALESFHIRGFGVISYDYPGYGESGGKPTEKGCYEAIEKTYRYLIEDQGVAPENIILVGQSVGSGPTCWLASQKNHHSIVLISPFLSAYQTVTHIPIFPGDRFPNYRHLKKVNSPLVVIHGVEGPRYIVNDITFPDIKIFKREELMPALSLIGNMPYSSKKMRDDIRMVRSYYGSRGYADVSVIPEVRELEGSKVDILYRITTGTRKRVGLVNIEGNTKSQERVIRREVPMQPGEFYNSVDLETTKRRLQNLGYFEDVQVTGAASSQDGYRDVNILVQEQRTGTINFGLGFSSIDRILGRINLEQSNFDITNWGRFTGAGQRFSVNLQAGSTRTDFRVSLVEPWFLGQKLSLGTDLYYRDLVFLSPEYDQRNIGASVFLRKPVGRRSYVKGEYRIETVEIEAESDTTQAFKDEEDEYLRSALSLNYVYDSRDSNQLPRRGHKVDLGLIYAGGLLAGDVDTITFTGSGTKHWSLPFDAILTARGSFAVVDSHGDNDRIPIFERQFLGGARDLRGFDFRDVGPRDDTGPNPTQEVLGGATSIFGSLELTFPVIGQVRGAVFYDAGFVNSDSWDFNTGRLASDVGVGVRLNLPGIGPLAVDFAVPVETPDEQADDGSQIQFYMDYQF
ncbi:outer membrane protein assembly factor BamA [Akkermansiaceae bacterium]|nr:outer membrane protein assembly factor BamA [Akkermansiaceae bacterium]